MSRWLRPTSLPEKCTFENYDDLLARIAPLLVGYFNESLREQLRYFDDHAAIHGY